MMNQQSHHPSFLLVFTLNSLLITLPSCLSVSPANQSSVKSTVQEELHPLYEYEGSKSVATPCKSEQDSSEFSVLDKYFAWLQGGKAVIKDQCVNDLKAEEILRQVLSSDTCSMEQCGTYDTYRRGPLWPALYLATLNTAFRENKVKVHSQSDLLNAGDGKWSISHQGTKEPTHKLKVGLFTKSEHREVYRQQTEFDLGPQTRCIAILKIYRDQLNYDRNDDLDHKQSSLTLTTPPSFGELWAEHRQSIGGDYEVLIIERRLARERGEGEVLERELLCQNSLEPVDPTQGYFRFSYRDINRDTTRVFAHHR